MILALVRQPLLATFLMAEGAQNFSMVAVQGMTITSAAFKIAVEDAEERVRSIGTLSLQFILILVSSPNKCLLPRVVGPCRAAFRRYFYNSDTKSCEPFIYGGCAGNANNFISFVDCQRECNSEQM